MEGNHMTVQDQIEGLDQLSNDIETHKALFDNFRAVLSASPIESTEQETIKAQYIESAAELHQLYLRVISEIAEWLTTQS